MLNKFSYTSGLFVMSSLENYLLKPFAHFFNKGFCFVGVFCLFLLLSCRSYLDILDTNLLSYIWFANIFLFFRFLFCPATAF